MLLNLEFDTKYIGKRLQKGKNRQMTTDPEEFFLLQVKIYGHSHISISAIWFNSGIFSIWMEKNYCCRCFRPLSLTNDDKGCHFFTKVVTPANDVSTKLDFYSIFQDKNIGAQLKN